MQGKAAVVESNPQILGGTPVFAGTRVPVQSLFDYLEAGETLDERYADFQCASCLTKEPLPRRPGVGCRVRRRLS